MSNIYIEEVNNFSDLTPLEEFVVGVEILKAFTNFKLDYNSDISDASQNGNLYLD